MNTIETIAEWQTNFQNDLVKKYNELGLRASGKWERSLRHELKVTEKGYELIQYGEHYTYQLENGRRAGKFPPIQAIEEWVKQKGIIATDISKKSLIFLISRKISQTGIQVPNEYNTGGLISDVFTKKRVDLLIDSIKNTKLREMKSDVLNSIKI